MKFWYVQMISWRLSEQMSMSRTQHIILRWTFIIHLFINTQCSAIVSCSDGFFFISWFTNISPEMSHNHNVPQAWQMMRCWQTQALYSAITSLMSCHFAHNLICNHKDYWVAFLTFFFVFFSFLSPSILERRNWANWSWNFIASVAEICNTIHLLDGIFSHYIHGIS